MVRDGAPGGDVGGPAGGQGGPGGGQAADLGHHSYQHTYHHGVIITAVPCSALSKKQFCLLRESRQSEARLARIMLKYYQSEMKSCRSG